jgi:predicted ATP-dependent endonuclease of OLD family
MLQTLNMVEAADEEVAKNIKKRNDQFKIAVPTLLSAWRFLRDSLDDGCNIANKTTLRLSVDILMRLIWEADSMDCLYLCVGSFTVLVVFDAFYLQAGNSNCASHSSRALNYHTRWSSAVQALQAHRYGSASEYRHEFLIVKFATVFALALPAHGVYL